jgi:hypothetical protein
VETKTNKQKVMVLLGNAERYESCVIHSLGSYAIKELESQHQQPPDFEGTAIFPKECGNSEGTTAQIISKILTSVKKKADKENVVIPGYPQNPTSTVLRSDSALFIANHKSKSLLLIFLFIALRIAFLPMNYLYELTIIVCYD